MTETNKHQQRRLQRTTYGGDPVEVDTTPHTEEMQAFRPSQLFMTFILGLVALLLGFVVLVGIVVGWPTIKAIAPVAAVAMLVVGIGITVLYVFRDFGFELLLKVLTVQEKRAEMKRAQESHETEQHLAVTRLPADERGNRAHIFDPYSQRILEVASGNFTQPVAHTYSPHIVYQNREASTRVTEEKEGVQPVAPLGIAAPTLDALMEHVPYNGLQVCLGVSASTGEPFTMDLVEGTHYRIIGGSGFGKSCQAAGMLDQLTQTNDTDHLLIALLDLEHRTSRLFEDLPHVAQLQVGRKIVDCVATSPDEVAQHFGYLRSELDRRKAMSEYDLERERFLLIYVEEFLSLRREVDPDLLEQMMKDFSILALRGRKYKLYLLACAQVDYADKDLRDAMNQFNVNMSFSVKPSAARAAGFSSNDLLKQNFAMRKRGQFVLETTGCSDLMLAARYDVKAKLQQLECRSRSRSDPYSHRTDTVQTAVQTVQTPFSDSAVQTDERTPELRSEVERLTDMGWGKQAIIEKVWQCKKGGSARYKQATSEYESLLQESETDNNG